MARAITMTNSEISMSFWVVSFLMNLITIKMVYDLFSQVQLAEFMMIFLLLPVGLVFSFMSMAWPNYLISKYHLNLLIDRITNSDYIGWLRFTRSKGFRTHIVKEGPLGQTHGVASGVKGDVVNRGDYTVTLMNGNKAIIVNDSLSRNINLEENRNWELIKTHHGFLGFDAWEKAVDDGKTTFLKVEDEEEEEVMDNGKIRLESGGKTKTN